MDVVNKEGSGKSVRKSSSQVMELKQLIAGPLLATIEADAMSAQKYLDYLMQVTFESYNPDTGETGKIRMLNFSYSDYSEGKEIKRNVSIPLITLVPMPLLHVEEADFDFDIKIVDCITEKYDESFSPEAGNAKDTGESNNKGNSNTAGYDSGKGVGNGAASNGFRMRASLAPKSESRNQSGELQQSISANMKVKVKMRQSDMPAGLSNLLQLAANNLTTSE